MNIKYWSEITLFCEKRPQSNTQDMKLPQLAVITEKYFTTECYDWQQVSSSQSIIMFFTIMFYGKTRSKIFIQEWSGKQERGFPVFSGNAWNPRTLSSSHSVSMSERKGWRTDRYLPSSPGKHQTSALLTLKTFPLKTKASIQKNILIYLFI